MGGGGVCGRQETKRQGGGIPNISQQEKHADAGTAREGGGT